MEFERYNYDNIKNRYMEYKFHIIETNKYIQYYLNEIKKINNKIIKLILYRDNLIKNNVLIKIINRQDDSLKYAFLKWRKNSSKTKRQDETLLKLLRRNITNDKNLLLKSFINWRIKAIKMKEENANIKLENLLKIKEKNTIITDQQSLNKSFTYWRIEATKMKEKNTNIELLLSKIFTRKDYDNQQSLQKSFTNWRVKEIKMKEEKLNKMIGKLNKKIQEFEQLKDKDHVLKMIFKKEEEIKELKKSLSRCPFQLSNGEKIISVIFTSVDQVIHYSIICKNTDIFSKLVNLLYDKYPRYRKDGGYFLCNSKKINEYLNLEENGIKNGDVIIFYNYN